MAFLIGFFLGLISSGIVGFIIYRKQKNDAIGSEKRLILTLQQQFKEVTSTVNDVSKSQEELLDSFNTIKEKFENAITSHNFTELLPIAQEYTKIANSIAEKNEHKISTSKKINLHFTIKYICKLHKGLFPKNYELAGSFRNSRVLIAGEGVKYIPSRPSDIIATFSDLLNWWNEKIVNMHSFDAEKKLDIITKFHHRFLSIHPFMDGNGRIARVLFIKQSEGIFNKKIKFSIDFSEYYKALSTANRNSAADLKKIFRNLLKM